ncbi:MAG TPA: hypothetical protein VJL08_01710 [Dehalococcoidia bacterium]|nr:hypothetical protein [Dehalococcoidia bacterium]HLE81671.1 hypothetical protein [Dehalococcoidia bacterium]
MSTTTGVECPSCEAVGKLVLISPDYDGPYACWKCRSIFNIAIRGGQVTSAVPTTREEVDRKRVLDKPSAVQQE